MKKKPHILIITGEVSGDQYGALCAKEILKQNPDSHIAAIGGSSLRNVAHNFIEDIAHHHVVGYTEAWQKRHFFKALEQKIKAYIDTHQVDKAIVIDFAHFNATIGKVLSQKKIPITTFITPNFWVWKDKRQTKNLCKYSDAIVTIFPKEYEWYKQFHSNVHFFGHPLCQQALTDTYDKKPTKPPYKIGLFPGSRFQELQYYLPTMLQSCQHLSEKYPETQFYISASSEAFNTHIDEMLEKYPVKNLEKWNRPGKALLPHVHAIVTASGTTTLEAAIHNTPLVILGALSWISYILVTKILRLDVTYIGMPNILLNKEVAKELIQKEITPKNLVPALEKILTSENTIQSQLADFKTIQDNLGSDHKLYVNLAKEVLKNV